MKRTVSDWGMCWLRWGQAHGASSGMASVEYALLLALLVIAGAAVWGALSESMRSLLETVANSFSRLPNP